VRTLELKTKKGALLVSGAPQPIRLAVHGGSPFWLTLGSSSSDGTLWTYDSLTEKPLSFLAGLKQPFAVASQGVSLVIGESGDGRLEASSVSAGGLKKSLVSALGSATALTASTSSVAWSVSGSLWILRDGSPTILRAGFAAKALYLDDTFVYATADGTSIARFPLAGGEPVEVATGLTRAVEIVGDATTVAWVDAGLPDKATGTVTAVNKTTLKVERTAANLAFPTGVALNASLLLWTASGDGTVGAVER
jgi:hypothetical protein